MTLCNEDAGLQQKLASAAIPDTGAIFCLFVSFSIFRLLVLETKILSQAFEIPERAGAKISKTANEAAWLNFSVVQLD